MKNVLSLLSHLRDIVLLPVTVTCLVPYWIYNSRETFFLSSPYTKAAGTVIAIAGLGMFFYTLFLFVTIGKGTLAPWSRKQKLIVRGPYRYCRNPMITGVLFILIGESFILSSTNILEWAGIFFLINNVYFLLFEEPDLYSTFGEDYTQYKKNVPRWLPRFTPYQPE